MAKLSEKILKTVQKEKLKIKPRWQFVLKRVLIWTALVVAILLGSIAVSMIMFQLTSIEWHLLSRFGPERPRIILSIVPYFWLFVAAILMTFVYFEFKQTKTGYRYRSGIIIAVAILISLILGTTIFTIRGPAHLEPFLRERMPFYENINFVGHRQFWLAPERGLLGGKVDAALDEKMFTLRDFHDQMWSVTILNNEDKYIYMITPGHMVKIEGEKTGDNEFAAKSIETWELKMPPRPLQPPR